MLLKTLCFFCALITCILLRAQSIDVQHYRFELELSDKTDTIKGKAFVRVRFLKEAKDFSLDLVTAVHKKGGMVAYKVLEDNNVLSSVHGHDTLKILLKKPAMKDDLRTFEVRYEGAPIDGLIISKNKYGDRTFFADNWPNRAHHWIPCNDVLTDKASVEFIVTAPLHYQVVSNGIKIEETNLDNNRTLTHWKEDIPLPVKVMVIGVGRFAMARVDSSYAVPVTAWVYPQNRKEGFYDYALATYILKFFSGYIGPYPFQKLANVQSKTIFGGMENASAIFYEEGSVTGTRKSERLLAHEIAHQWFGNMATEKSFAHLWLSEGFATYLTDMYIEFRYGKKAFQERMNGEREKVILFNKTAKSPVVDSVSGLMELLNPNSYEKGAFILHMLRNETGDSIFRLIIQSYYQQYKGGNADSRDFQRIAETVSGKQLGSFFDQWLHRPGLPKIKVQWKFVGSKVILTVQQESESKFTFPLEVAFVDAAGKQTVQKINVTPTTGSFEFPATKKPLKIVPDPDTKLLFEGTVEEGK